MAQGLNVCFGDQVSTSRSMSSFPRVQSPTDANLPVSTLAKHMKEQKLAKQTITKVSHPILSI